jgi:hypothetical protein
MRAPLKEGKHEESSMIVWPQILLGGEKVLVLQLISVLETEYSMTISPPPPIIKE